MSLKGPLLWDLPTRALHWVVAFAVVLNLFFLEEGEDPHEWAGYAAAVAVTLRLIWGFFGGKASRLSALPIHPRSVLGFLRARAKVPAGAHVGHNPLASLVYIAIWFCVFGLAGSGWMMGLDAFWGEDWVEELHGTFSLALKVFIVAHFLGLAFDSFTHRRRTWAGMITGRRG